ncbi:MAG: endopeptidase La [Verrucomicrobia bacterium]|nr:endopeptidase La [Verrucomicrobiota bacterium]
MSSPETEFISINDTSSGSDTTTFRRVTKPPPDKLPVLGLSDIVVFPKMVAPLLVESAQSIRLIDDVVQGERLIGLVLQRQAEVENPEPKDLHEFGCGARVLKMLKFPDNTVRILIEGLWRVRITGYESTSPYLVGRVEVLKDASEESPEIIALARHLKTQFEEIIKLAPAMPEEAKVAVLNTEAAGQLCDLIAANLNLKLEERQTILETFDVKQRMEFLRPLMDRELELARLGSKIQHEVTNTMAKNQRDFFLREQIRAIQRELGETDPTAVEVAALREQIERNGLSDEAKAVALKEVERLSQMSPAMAEYALTRNYIDWLVSLPWTQLSEDKFDLHQAERILNEQHYGLEKVKERLLEFLTVLKLKRNLKGPILCLVGPPGVGKTSLGKSVADALGRKFARISLGGLRDEAEIRGHRRTYVGAMPGRIIQSIRRVETRNPVIMLDELDKVGSDFRGDPASALLEVLDPQQNSSFIDLYLDVPFDLSQVLFFTTANWLDPIHPALRDRLEVLQLPSYTAVEKLQIAKRFLVPRQIEEHGLTKHAVKYPDATLKKLIQDYTREAGVRQLEREIAALTRKAARKIVTRLTPNGALTVKAEELKSFLGPAKFVSETAEKITESGIAVGLAWTPVGGDILFIEATRMTGKGGLILTGSLGDVMKESAQAALSYLRSQGSGLQIEFKDHDKFDIHVHVPAGATPKDGPSAGSTIVVALASLLTQRKVRSDVAMTGEISLRGRVLPVGGIKEKVLAAARSGIKQVILPELNRNDWEDVPKEIRDRMKVHFVRHISELIALALRPK